MKLLKTLFLKRADNSSNSNPVQHSKRLGRLIDQTAEAIFTAHRVSLLTESRTYVVPGVWGAWPEGRPSNEQADIHARVEAAMGDIRRALRLEELDSERRFAVEFIVRDLLIVKILWMVETFKTSVANLKPVRSHGVDLASIEPVGSA